MPTVSLNERGVVVRTCDSSTPSILNSLSLGSVADGSADMGVKVEKVMGRMGSPVVGPNGKGDSVPDNSLGGFSRSKGVGLPRFFFPDEDSEPLSGGCVCWGVITAMGCRGSAPDASTCWRTSADGGSDADTDGLPFRGGG